jgi:tetratricopeptide (TPR) repeat protein
MLSTPPVDREDGGAAAESSQTMAGGGVAAGLPTLPGYEILVEVGRGGMGVVYKAQQSPLKRLVALKMILTGLHADSLARKRFLIEAEAIARLQHPNIVQVHELGEHDGKPFLALEFIEGGNLLRKIAGKPQPERDAAQLMEALARAVHYTHERGILHRDLKPNNVLLTAEGAPKITDFGLAKLVDADSKLSRSQAFLGTPSYMAPEQAAGDSKRVGATADVYSLGAIFYELLTGRPPFHGATPLSTMEQARNQDPVPPRRLRPSISRDLETICLKCLEKEPGKRYASAEALADDLRRFSQGDAIRARPMTTSQRWWRAVRSRPAHIGWSLAAVGMVGLVLFAWSYTRAADQLRRHQAEAKFQQFIDLRNEALVYGMLTAEEGELLLGGDATANVKAAEAAVRRALAWAGVNNGLGNGHLAGGFPPARETEIVGDCYTLLLLMAGVMGEQSRLDGSTGERCREALRILEDASPLGFETRAYYLRRARLLEQLGDTAQARRETARAGSVVPAGALDYFLEGEAQYRCGDSKRAIDAFNHALSLQPDHFWAQFFLAVCHLKLKHADAARAELNACIAQQPGFVWPYLFRSLANEELGAAAEAEADFQKAIDFGVDENARYVLFLARGVLRFKQNELAQAAADFRLAISLRPDQYNAYVNLAHVSFAQGRFDESQEQARTAAELGAPGTAIASYHVERGRKLLRGRQCEEALAANQTALALAPRYSPCHELNGQVLLELARYNQAEAAFDRYFDSGGEVRSEVFRGRGFCRMKLGKYPDAVEDYTRALELRPDADIYQHRGWAHFFSDAWKLALRDFSKAIELDPEAGDAYTGRGLAHVMLGDYRKANADADAALRRRPDSPEMMHNIACIFAQALWRVQSDQTQSDRGPLSASYRGKALAAIHQTLAMLRPEERLSFWQNKILPDAALKPIHNDAEFQRLGSEVGRRRLQFLGLVGAAP